VSVEPTAWSSQAPASDVPPPDRLRLGCGALLLLAASGLLVAYLASASLVLVGGAEALQLAVLSGAMAGVIGLAGGVFMWTGLVPPPGPGVAVTAVRRASAMAWLAAFGLVLLAGQAVLATGPMVAALFLPPLHFLAALLPALALTAWLPWRAKLVRIAYGSCVSAGLALVAEVVMAVGLLVAVYLVLSVTATGQATIATIRHALETASQSTNADLAALAPLLLQPVILVSVFAMFALLGPVVEETAKVSGIALRPPLDAHTAWLWGVAIGAGFGVTEAVGLGAMGLPAWPMTMVVRASATVMHATMTGIASLGLYAIIVEARWRRGIIGLGLAVLGHSAWNGLVLLATLAGTATAGQAASGQQVLGGIAAVGLLALWGVILVTFYVLSTRHEVRPPPDPA
jgi:hypothetical protein